MKTLDRYIIREFLINFAILLLVLMSLFVLIDFIIGLNRFVNASEDLAEAYGGRWRAMAAVTLDYYLPVVVMVYVFLSGLVVVGAMGFTIAGLQRSRELIAITASGVSLYRVAAPILLAGIALNALSLPIQEFLIPDMAPKLVRSKSELSREASDSFPIRFVPDGEGRLFTAMSFDAGDQRLDGLTVIERAPDGLYARRITTQQAFWEEHGQRWRLVPEGLAVEPHLEGPQGTAVFNGAEPSTVAHLRTDLSPAALMARQATLYPQLLSLRELQQMQGSLAIERHQREHIARIIWGRFSLLVVNVLVLVMGMAFFLRLGQVDMIRQAVLSSAVCMGAWGLGMLMIQAGGVTLNPVASAWLPVVLLLPVTAGLLQLVRT